MLYHQTKDVLFVKEFLGHRKIDSTLLYIQLERTLFKETTDEFTESRRTLKRLRRCLRQALNTSAAKMA